MELRVVDAGTVDAWVSQALWHGIAAAMEAASPPVLSLCRPAEPYVGLGYHRPLDELDLAACRRLGLPVIRRQIGGGPVYVDSDQLFFQITSPAARAPGRVDVLYERFLEPAVDAFRALGLEARRNGLNDIAVGPREGPRKISGTGAGQIGGGVTVVGNVLFRFPHERMVEVLALPGDRLRRECLRLMRRHVSSLAAEGLGALSFGDAKAALIEAYGRALEARPVAAALTAEEEAAVRRWEDRLRDPAWLAGRERPPRSLIQVKVSADAWLVAASGDGLSVEASLVGGRLERLAVAGEGLGGAAEEMGRALAGQPARADAARRALEPFGAGGRRVLEALEPALR